MNTYSTRHSRHTQNTQFGAEISLNDIQFVKLLVPTAQRLCSLHTLTHRICMRELMFASNTQYVYTRIHTHTPKHRSVRDESVVYDEITIKYYA